VCYPRVVLMCVCAELSLSISSRPILFDCYIVCLFFYCYFAHRYLHSFPTRRSSDLVRGSAKVISRYASTPCVYDLWSPFSPSTVDRKSTRLNSSHVKISYAVFCLKKKKSTASNDDTRPPQILCLKLTAIAYSVHLHL